MVRNKKEKERIRDVHVIPGERQHQLLLCNIMVCAVKDVVKPFASNIS